MEHIENMKYTLYAMKYLIDIQLRIMPSDFKLFYKSDFDFANFPDYKEKVNEYLIKYNNEHTQNTLKKHLELSECIAAQFDTYIETEREEEACFIYCEFIKKEGYPFKEAVLYLLKYEDDLLLSKKVDLLIKFDRIESDKYFPILSDKWIIADEDIIIRSKNPHNEYKEIDVFEIVDVVEDVKKILSDTFRISKKNDRINIIIDNLLSAKYILPNQKNILRDILATNIAKEKINWKGSLDELVKVVNNWHDEKIIKLPSNFSTKDYIKKYFRSKGKEIHSASLNNAFSKHGNRNL